VVRLESIGEPDCAELLARFERASVHVGVWDITTDVGIAAFRVVIMDRELNPERPLRPHVGMGCHPSRGIALLRALTEAAQARLTVISSSRDDLPRERYSQSRDLEFLRELRRQETAGPGVRCFSDVPDFESDDVAADVAFERDSLVARGFEHAIVVDLTRAEFSIPVVRAIVPGLEGSREVPGWVPGKRGRDARERGAA
jgi:ribosomal protein S12 methylthiotransferase accessory factor